VSANPEKVRALLLNRGLEDWIPIPEVAEEGEVRDAAGETDPIGVIERALAELVKARKIRLFRGEWDEDDPAPVGLSEALNLLRDRYWYTYHLDDPQEQRLFFVNVDNIQE
jgi:hypothetical protein